MSAKKLLPLALLGGGLWWLSRNKNQGKKKSGKTKTPAADLPSDNCGLYPWLPREVDMAITARVEAGEHDAEALALHAARTVPGECVRGTHTVPCIPSRENITTVADHPMGPGQYAHAETGRCGR